MSNSIVLRGSFMDSLNILLSPSLVVLFGVVFRSGLDWIRSVAPFERYFTFFRQSLAVYHKPFFFTE